VLLLQPQPPGPGVQQGRVQQDEAVPVVLRLTTPQPQQQAQGGGVHCGQLSGGRGATRPLQGRRRFVPAAAHFPRILTGPGSFLQPYFFPNSGGLSVSWCPCSVSTTKTISGSMLPPEPL